MYRTFLSQIQKEQPHLPPERQREIARERAQRIAACIPPPREVDVPTWGPLDKLKKAVGLLSSADMAEKRMRQEEARIAKEIANDFFLQTPDFASEGEAEAILTGKRSCLPFSWRTFVLRLGGAVSWYAKYQGGRPVDSVRDWQEVLTQWAKQRWRFIDSIMTSKLAKELLQRFDRLVDLSVPLSHRSKAELSQNDVERAVKAFRNGLAKQLKQHSYAYCFMGPRGEEVGRAGHVMLARFEKRGKDIYLTLMNLGDGVNAHPIVKKDPRTCLRSYAFLPIKISEAELMKGHLGYCALAHIVRYESDTPLPQTHYDSSDIYDVWRLVGEVVPRYDLDEDLLALPEQQVPNCSEVAIQLFIRDNLCRILAGRFDNDRILLEIEKVQFEFNFCQLLNAYRARANSVELQVFQYALQVFAFKLLDMRPSISEEEFIALSRAVHHMQQKQAELALPQAVEVKSGIRFNPTLLALPDVKVVEEEVELAEGGGVVYPKVPTLLPHAPFAAKLASWMEYIQKLQGKEAFDFFCKEMYALSPPKFGEEDEWDLIALSEIPRLIEQIHAFVQLGMAPIEPLRGEHFEDVFFTLHIAYMIVDKLARRNPRNGLFQFASPFLLEGEDKKQIFITLIFADQQKLYAQIESYFKASRERWRPEIFPVARKLDVEHAVHTKSLGGMSPRLHAHVRYLEANFMRKGDRIADAWMRVLPKEVQTLYYFAFVCQAILDNRGFGRMKKLPSHLDLTLGSDSRGKDALLLNKEIAGEGIAAPFNNSHQEWEWKIRAKEYYTRPLTTNEAASQVRPRDFFEISVELWRDILRLTVEDEIALHAFLDWLPFNYTALDEPRVRDEVHRAFFAPGKLAHALEEDPSVIERFRSVFHAVVKEFGLEGAHKQALRFVLECSLCVEAMLPLEKRDLSVATLLIEEWGVMWGYYRLFLLSLSKAYTGDDTAYIARCLFKEKSSFLPPTAIERREEKWLENCYPLFLRCLEDEEYRGSICMSVMEMCDIEEDPPDFWELNGAVARNSKYEIDFEKRTVVRVGVGLRQKQKLSGAFGGIRSKPMCEAALYGEPHYLTDADQTFVLETRGGVRTLRKKVKFGGVEVEGIYVKVDTSLWGKAVSSKLEQYDAYRLPDGNLAFFTDTQEGELLVFVTEMKEDGLQMRRIYAGGEVSPFVVVDLSKVPADSKLAPLAARFEFPDQVVCEANLETGEVLAFFFHSPLNLFVLRGCARRFPRCRLQIDQIWEGYRDALVFENQEGERKIILPFRLLSHANPELGSPVKPLEQLFSVDQSYGVFTEDRITGDLVAENPIDYLYLALLYKMQRKFDKAVHYLKKMTAISDLEAHAEPILDYFRNLGERSNYAYAFNMRLLWTIVDHKNRLQKRQFEQREILSKKTRAWGEAVYRDYLGTLSQDGFYSEVPKNLRLCAKEEATILRAIYAAYDKESGEYKGEEKKGLPDQLKSRMLSLCMPERITTERIGELPVELGPCAFSNGFTLCEKRPKRELAAQEEVFVDRHLPVRYPLGAAYRNFRHFFEQARKAPPSPCEFDFTLLALFSSYEDPSEPKASVASLLLYVRYHPKEFARFTGKEENLVHQVYDQIRSKPPEKINRFKDFLKRSVSFQAKHAEEKLQFPIQALEQPHPLPKPQVGQPISHKLFVDYLEGLYDQEEVPFTKPERSPFEREQLSGLESSLLETMRAGYAALDNEKSVRYTPKAGAQVEEIKEKILKDVTALDKSLHEEHATITAELNALPRVVEGRLVVGSSLEAEFHMCSVGQQRRSILPAHIMKEVILRGDARLLKVERPHLSDPQINDLIVRTKNYYKLLVWRSMLMDAIKYIECGEHQKVGELLDYEFEFSVDDYPEIFYYKVISGKLPRKEQFAVYRWVCEGFDRNEDALFQLAAGAGKTSYLRQLFMLRLRMYGLMPVAVTPPAIYQVDKQNLEEGWVSMGESLALLELGIHHQLNSKDYNYILRELERYHDEGRALLITPEAFYALQLQAQNAALQEGDEKKVGVIHKILRFFKEKCGVLMDETHNNLDPITRAIFGMQGFEKVQDDHCRHLMNFMLPLFNLPAVKGRSGRTIAELSHLTSRPIFQERVPTKEEFEELQDALVTHIFPSARSGALRAFLTKKEASPPDDIKLLEKHDQERLALARHFLITLLPELLKKRTNYDHMRSLHGEEDFHTPARTGTPSTAQFQDPYLAIVLTIKGYFQQGLEHHQLTALLKKLVEFDLTDRKHGEEFGFIAQEFDRIAKKYSVLNGIQLRHLNLEDYAHTHKLHTLLKNDETILQLFLTEIAFPQIGFSPQQVSVSPAALAQGFKLALCYSATPMHETLYPTSIKRLRSSAKFEAQVVAQYCKPENQCYLSFESLEKLFDSQKEQVLIDPGGFFPMENQEVAHIWLASNPRLRGVLYFGNQGVELLLRGKREPHFMQGSDNLGKQLAHLGVDLQALGVYFDAQHTEAANIDLPDDAGALLLVPDALGSARLLQALMRMRGFLDPLRSQRVTWVLAPGVREQLPELTGEEMYRWTAGNDAKKMRKQIALAALQEINEIIAQPAKIELEEAEKQGGDALVRTYRRYANGFIELAERDLMCAFATPEREEELVAVLECYAASLHRRFYGKEIVPQISASIDPVIKRAAAHVHTISTNLAMGGEVQQQRQQQRQQQVEVVEVRPLPQNPIRAERVTGDLKLTRTDLFEQVSRKIHGSHFYQNREFAKYLSLDESHTKTAHLSDDSSKQLLKPITHFFVIEKEGSFVLYVIDAGFVASYKREMESCEEERLPHTVLLISALSGAVVARGKGALRMSKEMEERILASAQLRDSRIDAALVQGKILHQEHGLPRKVVIQRLSRIPNLSRLLHWLKDHQISQKKGRCEGWMGRLLSEVEVYKATLEAAKAP
ncbi:MAG: DUF3638 domain-containing protein [Chlamydiales bacterium]|nr:DUF3638 domain-containing protein [Chlamydiales bacterium]